MDTAPQGQNAPLSIRVSLGEGRSFGFTGCHFHSNFGIEPFRRLLNDGRFAECAFIAETPVDETGDEERNVRVLKSLVKEAR